MTPEGDALRGVCSGMAPGGRALEVDLGSAWSDSENCGCSVTEAVDYCENF